MARTKNEAEPSTVSTGTVQVNVDDFKKTRDSVIVALASLQSSVQDLSRAYIEHANTVLGPQASGQLSLGLAATLLDTGLVGQQVRGTSPPRSDAGGDSKKKRKRAPHDPNAPKRALTPYFLYMQSARSQIASELGDHAKPKEVADEGTRRWAAMAEEDKSVWNQLYARNLAIYREKMKAYKAGQPVPDDEAAAKLVDSGAVPIPDPVEAESDEDSSPEPVTKAPSPPKSGKRRKTGDKPAAPTPAKETPASAKKSPEKKKADKKSEKAAPAAKPATPATETGKKKKTSKK